MHIKSSFSEAMSSGAALDCSGDYIVRFFVCADSFLARFVEAQINGSLLHLSLSALTHG